MQADDITLARSLLLHQQVLTLAVVVEGEPCAGLLPFAATTELDAVLVHASRLARHTRGLAAGSPFSAVIHKPEGPGVDPLQVPRLFLDGTVEILAKDSAAYGEGRDLYEAKLPAAAPIFSLGDFDLYRLVIAKARLVVGFARAVRVDLSELARTP